jgi:hypothetical protein
MWVDSFCVYFPLGVICMLVLLLVVSAIAFQVKRNKARVLAELADPAELEHPQ